MNYKDIMDRVWTDVQAQMPEHVERLSWPHDQVAAYQTRKLRELLKTAKEKTRYYGEVLAGIDVETFELSDLGTLPPHDKIAQMERWNDFVTAPELTYETAEAHMGAIRSGKDVNPFFENKYVFVATGGSTGKRGLFVWDLEFIRQIILRNYRELVHDERQNGYDGPYRLATVEAPTLLHGSPYAFTAKFLPDVELLALSSTDPIPQACEKLNAFQPTHLMAYASSVAELATAQLKGELNIKPRWVATNSGPQDEDIRDRSMRAWGTKASNTWGCCEIGMMAIETASSPGMVTCEDSAIIEVVDKNNQPVSRPEDAAKVLATNLTNFTMPMIRYEVDDIIEMGPPLPAFPGFRTVTRILGKATFWFHYGDIKVHPTAFSNVLEEERPVEEFQIVQTPDGAYIKLVCGGKPDFSRIKDTIVSNLAEYGLKDAAIDFEIVPFLPHHPETGKITRFIPI